jgi:hypothetical protein
MFRECAKVKHKISFVVCAASFFTYSTASDEVHHVWQRLHGAAGIDVATYLLHRNGWCYDVVDSEAERCS